MAVIDIVKEFTNTPGGRKRDDGKFSGEEFREEHLEKHFRDIQDKSAVTIILDGVEGYATSFLEEAFGGLARKFGKQVCLDRLRFVSKEDPLLPEEITRYIEDADDRR